MSISRTRLSLDVKWSPLSNSTTLTPSSSPLVFFFFLCYVLMLHLGHIMSYHHDGGRRILMILRLFMTIMLLDTSKTGIWSKVNGTYLKGFNEPWFRIVTLCMFNDLFTMDVRLFIEGLSYINGFLLCFNLTEVEQVIMGPDAIRVDHWSWQNRHQTSKTRSLMTAHPRYIRAKSEKT